MLQDDTVTYDQMQRNPINGHNNFLGRYSLKMISLLR